MEVLINEALKDTMCIAAAAHDSHVAGYFIVSKGFVRKEATFELLELITLRGLTLVKCYTLHHVVYVSACEHVSLTKHC